MCSLIQICLSWDRIDKSFSDTSILKIDVHYYCIEVGLFLNWCIDFISYEESISDRISFW